MDRRIVEQLRLGRGINATARQLKVCRRTVRRVKADAEKLGLLDPATPLPPFPEELLPHEEPAVSSVDELLGAHKEWIAERLAAGWHKITVYEELPLTVSRSAFYRFLERHGLRRKRDRSRVVPEIVHRPGEALQLDWGLLCTMQGPDGRKIRVWAFVGVLCYSRYRMVRLVTKCDVPTTLSMLESMLEELGGVPQRLTTDNPKVFVLEASKYEPLLNPFYEMWTSHYSTVAECLPPADPQKKGKVERQMPYIRRLFEAYGPVKSIEEAQAYVNQKLLIANQAKHGTTRRSPLQQLDEVERAHLRPLPVHPFHRKDYHCGKVRADGHVLFRGKYYSLDERYIGKEVQIIGGDTQVVIHFRGKVIEVHARHWDRETSKSTKPEHLRPWMRALSDQSQPLRRARLLGPAVYELVKLLIERGDGFVDYRRVWGVLSLDKRYAACDLNAACARCLEMGEVGYRYVRRELEMMEGLSRSQRSTPSSATQGSRDANRFVRDVSEYTAFLQQQSTTQDREELVH